VAAGAGPGRGGPGGGAPGDGGAAEAPPPAGPAAGGALLTAGILAVAFNMRGAITGLPPVFPELTRVAGLSAAAESVLAGVPVLGFALFSLVAPALARRLGEERVVGLALALLAGGLAARAAAPGILLFPGTVVASCAIALMNVLLPSLVKRRRPGQAGLLVGLYMMTLTTGAVIAAVIAVPAFIAAGGSAGAVRLTYGMWALPALAGAVAWLPQLRFRTPPPPPAGRAGVLEMARHALAWQVTAFMGLQSLSYYATLSWFPTMFRDHGIAAAAAGNLLALMNAGNAASGLVVPVLAHRARDQRALAAVAVAAIAAGLAGAAFGPNEAAIPSVCVLGLGQGGAFGLAVYFFTARAADGHASAALSGFAQGAGYLVASLGPLLLGLLHAVTGGWTVPASVLLAAAAGQLAAGLLAGRAMTVGAPGHRPDQPAAVTPAGR